MDPGRFEKERRRLVLLAYRMCGSWADAEDVVQQVAIEWWRAKGEVLNAAGWLTRTTVRRAIDVLRARRREAAYVGPWVPEPIVEAPGADPYVGVEQSDALGMAFLMLLELLTPPQRAVVVLRSLGYEHAEIAGILDISAGASRQHYTRGTRRLAQENHRPVESDPSIFSRLDPADLDSNDRNRQKRLLINAFLWAARDGDIDMLATLLHKDVRAYNDGGGRTRAARRVLLGVGNVARFAAGVAALHEGRRQSREAIVNGEPGMIVELSGVTHVLSIQVREGRIYRLFDVCNPDKLRSLPRSKTEAPARIADLAQARWSEASRHANTIPQIDRSDRKHEIRQFPLGKHS